MDEIDKSNRHDVMVPSHIRKRHPALRFLHIFQRWIKPILAEFVATFILIFWACMLQPTVSSGRIFQPRQKIIYSPMQSHIFRINSFQLFQLDLHWLLSSLCFQDICVIQFNPGTVQLKSLANCSDLFKVGTALL